MANSIICAIFLIFGELMIVTHAREESILSALSPVSRFARSVEGEPCKPAISESSTDTCTLAYTICNPKTRLCQCNANVSVQLQLHPFPDALCIPLQYVNATGHCLPTSPDICAALVPGSFCDARDLNSGHLSSVKCSCRIGGFYPDCLVRIGSICQQNSTCEKDVPNSYCSIESSDGFGRCACGGEGSKKYSATLDGSECRPMNCAANPCLGDLSASTCLDTESGFKCACRNSSKGRSHTPEINGICCSSEKLTCQDFSRCISVSDLCNGHADCDDCSDEKHIFCTGHLPQNVTSCKFPGDLAKGQMSVPVVVAEPLPIMAVVPQLGAAAGSFFQPGSFFGPYTRSRQQFSAPAVNQGG